MVVSSCARSAVEVSVPADASSSVEAEDSEPTSSPISDSNSRVILSTRWPRSILASASSVAASSETFLAISACLNTCKVRHGADLGRLTLMRHLRGQVAAAQRLHRRDDRGNPARDVANQKDADANAE